MTLHAFRILAGPPTDDTHAAIRQWTPDLILYPDGTTENDITVAETPDGDLEYAAVTIRLYQSKPLASLLSSLETHLDPVADWYRVGYHECHHDESTPGNCKWIVPLQTETVPADAPGL